MKPLVTVTAYNRPQATANCLVALDDTTDFSACVLAVVDDRSEPDAWELVRSWAKMHQGDGVYALRMAENGGTARALNYAIAKLREPGQAVVKIDNDMEVLTPNWNAKVAAFAEAVQRQGDRVATIRAWRRYRDTDMPGETPLYRVANWRGTGVFGASKHLGYAVWYTGAFMDRVGFFEPLSPDHRYGFDDVIMGHKAQVLGWHRLIWEGWKVRDQARGTAVEDKDGHIAMARPLLRRRLEELYRTGNVRADERGEPV